MSRNVRPAAVAGQFYPAEPQRLRQAVDELLAAAASPKGSRGAKALVVPHAGYVYSGPVAATAYALLRGRDQISQAVLLGPAHFHPLHGMAVPTVEAFETPLGLVPIDPETRELALSAAGVVADDAPHAPEHSLEVQLPFLQRALPAVAVLPVAVGPAAGEAVADLLDAVWGGPETVILVSTDLSHYLHYEAARERDRATADAIVSGRRESLRPEDACGFYPLRGFLLAAARHRLAGRILDLRSSGDTAGPRDSVVGYGAFAFVAREADHRLSGPGSRRPTRAEH